MSGEYPIEHGIPLPERTRGGQRGTSKYPFYVIEIGDSFFVAGAGDSRHQTMVISSTSHARKRTGREFSTRQVDGGIRVWRTQ
jgi:hypothetical protein